MCIYVCVSTHGGAVGDRGMRAHKHVVACIHAQNRRVGSQGRTSDILLDRSPLHCDKNLRITSPEATGLG